MKPFSIPPASRVLRVINSCQRVDQITAAQFYIARWLRLSGHGMKSEASRLLFMASDRKVYELLGRAPGKDALEPSLAEPAGDVHGHEKEEDAKERQ